MRSTQRDGQWTVNLSAVCNLIFCCYKRAVGADVQALIFKQAEGNPFYVEELTKSLLEMRALEQDEHGYVLTQSAPQGKIPETIQNVIAARIDRLPEREKRLMQAAAVIGREFPLQLLQKIAEEEHEIIDSLQHLQALGLIYDRGFFLDPRYLFKHALTQDVAYHSLLTPRRQALHEAIGAAIEGLYSARSRNTARSSRITSPGVGIAQKLCTI